VVNTSTQLAHTQLSLVREGRGQRIHIDQGVFLLIVCVLSLVQSSAFYCQAYPVYPTTTITKIIMPPMNPEDLLRAFEPYLTRDGGIKAADLDCKEASPVCRLTSLMRRYSKKLVSRCVYLNVLMQTREDVLEEFLVSGGWEILHQWLIHSKDIGNAYFLIELLKLLDKCPVTVNRLKVNEIPKVVKKLSKEGESTEVVKLSKKLVDKWMALVNPKKVKDSSVKKLSIDKEHNYSCSDKKMAVDSSVDGSKGKGDDQSNNKDSKQLNGKEVAETKKPSAGKDSSNGVAIKESSAFLDAICKPPSDQKLSKKKPKPLIDSGASKPKKPRIQSGGDVADVDVDAQIEADIKSPKVRHPSSSTSFATPTNHASPAPANVTPSQGPCKSFPRGCLRYTRSEKRKSVQFLPDQLMTAVKYFDVDENERTNVFRDKMVQGHVDQRAEGQAFKQRVFDLEDNDNEKWIALIPIDLVADLPPATVVYGRDSVEKLREAERQRSTLFAFFSSKELGPDSPYEPEEDYMVFSDASAKVIPLEDPLGGPPLLTDYSGVPWPRPVVSQPVVNSISNPLIGTSFQSSYHLDHRAIVNASSPTTFTAPDHRQRTTMFAMGKPSADFPTTKDGRGVCRSFATTGTCKWNPCKFLHIRDSDASSTPPTGNRPQRR